MAKQSNTTDLKPTSVSGWKARKKPGHAVRLPSGNVALLRRVGPEAFMASGLIPDPLTPIVQKAIRNKKGLPPEAAADMITDPKLLGAMVEMIDRVTVYAVIEPTVVMPPACVTCNELNTAATAAVHDHPESPEGHKFEPGERDEDTLYVDEVDLEDKTFIMNFCLGGSADLERFREEQSATLGSISAVQGMEVQA